MFGVCILRVPEVLHIGLQKTDEIVHNFQYFGGIVGANSVNSSFLNRYRRRTRVIMIYSNIQMNVPSASLTITAKREGNATVYA